MHGASISYSKILDNPLVSLQGCHPVARSTVFLDRDGVINHDTGYSSSAENFRFIDGIFYLCRAAKQSGYLLIFVTN